MLHIYKRANNSCTIMPNTLGKDEHQQVSDVFVYTCTTVYCYLYICPAAVLDSPNEELQTFLLKVSTAQQADSSLTGTCLQTKLGHWMAIYGIWVALLIVLKGYSISLSTYIFENMSILTYCISFLHPFWLFLHEQCCSSLWVTGCVSYTEQLWACTVGACCESTIYLPAPAAVMLAASLAAASPAALDIYAKSLPILPASSPAACSTTGRSYNTFVPLGFGGVAQLAKFSFHQ